MSEQKSGQYSRSARKKEDPLAGLYQIDTDESIPVEEEVLVLMVNLLHNIEELKELRDIRRKIVAQGELMETRLLSLQEVVRANRVM